jgi:hypothetical protein
LTHGSCCPQQPVSRDANFGARAIVARRQSTRVPTCRRHADSSRAQPGEWLEEHHRVCVCVCAACMSGVDCCHTDSAAPRMSAMTCVEQTGDSADSRQRTARVGGCHRSDHGKLRRVKHRAYASGALQRLSPSGVAGLAGLGGNGPSQGQAGGHAAPACSSALCSSSALLALSWSLPHTESSSSKSQDAQHPKSPSTPRVPAPQESQDPPIRQVTSPWPLPCPQ